ncbi:hypothetical protein HY358_00200, partial [Candidatus Roizmanbacteria bacterium]|nr:hypothetical protein [Candidatus Roizmanbacteria bacterium]
AIRSQEFWENYFREHPEQRPKHVVYYREDSPTKALDAWRQCTGLTKKSDSKTLDFDEKTPQGDMETIPNIQEDFEEFKQVLSQVLSKKKRVG